MLVLVQVLHLLLNEPLPSTSAAGHFIGVPCSRTSFHTVCQQHYTLLGWYCNLYLCVCVFVHVFFTLHTAAWSHAGLEILSMRTWHAEVQLRLQHPLPHPAAFFTRSAAARRPWRPARVDACLWCVI